MNVWMEKKTGDKLIAWVKDNDLVINKATFDEKLKDTADKSTTDRLPACMDLLSTRPGFEDIAAEWQNLLTQRRLDDSQAPVKGRT